MKNRNTIAVRRGDLIEILRDLNRIVVSIDRIGSCASDMTKSQNDKLLLDFLDKWDVWSKLAKIRMKLSTYFATDIGEDGMDELEREMQNIQYWSETCRSPFKEQR